MSKTPKSCRPQPRVRKAERHQLEFRSYNLDSLLADDHRARMMWAAVEQLDLSQFYDEIVARGSRPGRAATDPKVLLTLWLYATSEGVGSARHLARLCERDNVYRWISGGLSMNYHTLADFRVEHGDKLDELLTQLLAILMKQGLIKLRRVAQDGVRVRASAGAASFRRKPTLNEFLKKARQQVRNLRKELEEKPGATSAREKAARERAARERKEALELALAELETIEQEEARKKGDAKKSNTKKKATKKEAAKKKAAKKRERRASTTDREARVMKMGDGGFRPAFNIQFAADTSSRFIVGVGVTNIGSDKSQMLPMCEQVEARTGKRPRDWLVDGGFAKLDAIGKMETKGIRVFAPVQASRTKDVDPHARKKKDTDQTMKWRGRMKKESAKKIYRERAATAETVNADLRAWRGLQQFRVRGIAKVKSISLLSALTYNLLRWGSLTSAAT